MTPYPPMVSPRFQFNYETIALEYKPFPSYPSWQTAWDLATFIMILLQQMHNVAQNVVYANNDNLHLEDMNGRVTTLEGQTAQLSSDLAATNAVANQGVTDAATAYGLAEQASIEAGNAQTTANTALALAQSLETDIANFNNNRMSVFADELEWSSGYGGGLVVNSAYPYALVGYSSAQNAIATHQFYALAGTWEFKFWLPKGNNLGKHDIILDGATISDDYDQYAAVAAPANMLTISGVSIAESGIHQISIVNVGKNAASSGYSISICKMWGKRTAL